MGSISKIRATWPNEQVKYSLTEWVGISPDAGRSELFFCFTIDAVETYIIFDAGGFLKMRGTVVFGTSGKRVWHETGYGIEKVKNSGGI